jgi:hypothetical protein
MNYYYRDKSGTEIGPLTLDALARLRFGGVLDGDTPVRVADSSDWRPCREIIADAPQTAPSAAPTPMPAASAPGKPSAAWHHGWSLFALAGLCFLLPFLDLSCQGRKVVTLTGQQLVTGTEVEQPPDPLTGRKEMKRVEPYRAAQVALGLGVVALLLSVPRKRTTSMLTGLAGAGGVVALLVLKSGIESEIATQGQGLVTLTMREGFWLACILIAGGIAAQFKVFNDVRTGRAAQGLEDWKIPRHYKVTLAVLAIGGVLAYGGAALYRSLSERAAVFVPSKALISTTAIPPLTGSANPSVPQSPKTPQRQPSGFIEDLSSDSHGTATGIRYVSTPNGGGAAFSRTENSRIEYSFFNGFPAEGTLEWRIQVNNGYGYDKGVLSASTADALIFTTVGPDTWYPGCAWVRVSKNGTVTFGMADSVGGQMPLRALTAENTGFTFGEWHTVGISFGSNGRSINVDGRVVAHDDLALPLAPGGTPTAQVGAPTIGEMMSRFWPNHQYDSGFDGVLDSFRASSKQADWKLCK